MFCCLNFKKNNKKQKKKTTTKKIPTHKNLKVAKQYTVVVSWWASRASVKENHSFYVITYTH